MPDISLNEESLKNHHTYIHTYIHTSLMINNRKLTEKSVWNAKKIILKKINDSFIVHFCFYIYSLILFLNICHILFKLLYYKILNELCYCCGSVKGPEE